MRYLVDLILPALYQANVGALGLEFANPRRQHETAALRRHKLPDHLLLYPAHYSGSVCGRGLSSNPASSIGFERRHNRALRHGDEDAFVAALLEEIPPAPEHQAEIVAANRAGRPLAGAR